MERPLLDDDGYSLGAEDAGPAFVTPSVSASSSVSNSLRARHSASLFSPSAYPAPNMPWSHYFSLNSLTRRKTAAIVMAEAAEDSGRPTPPSHAESSVPPTEEELAQEAEDEANRPPVKAGLAKVLTIYDIIAYGISSTIGAGIFVSTGAGTLAAGPAVMISFMLASLSCLFSAFAYSEFAARVPVAGSAYTFTYVCLGELAAWFIGWNLTLEYCISAAAVARGWSSNVAVLFAKLGAPIPAWLNSIVILTDNSFLSSLSPLSAIICLACMALLLVGVKESARVNLAVTVMNISIILFIIVAGATYVTEDNFTAAAPFNTLPANEQCNTSATTTLTQYRSIIHFTTNTDVNSYWPYEMTITTSNATLRSLQNSPYPYPASGSYFPNGLNGVLTGAALVFFSYVGFDGVTTLAEEVKNPKRDLPIGIISTLAIVTALYIGASTVLTGMVPWYCVDLNTPLASAFDFAGNTWATTLIAACSVTGLAATVLASLFGQPRIFYRMAKDGLIFQFFASIHPKTQTPYWGTIATGITASIIGFFLSIDSLQNMISIGTLMAFTTVCAGIVLLRYQPMPNAALGLKFNPAFWLLLFFIPALALCIALRFMDSVHISIPIILAVIMFIPVIRMYFLPLNTDNYNPNLFVCPLVPWLPCLGMFTNLYLITSLDWESYVRIVVWTLIGFAIYFGYGIRYSRLARPGAADADVLVQDKHEENEGHIVNSSSSQF